MWFRVVACCGNIVCYEFGAFVKYKLTINPAMELGNDVFKQYFDTEIELHAAAECCADLLLYIQDYLVAMDDYNNIFIKEQLINGEWEVMDEA